VNTELANIFWELAEYLELKQDNPFKIRAYQKAAQNIEALSGNLQTIYKKGGLAALQQIPGIGSHIAEKIQEYTKTGKVSALQKLKKEFPKNFLQLVEIPGLGPKTALMLYKELKIDSPEKLTKAAKAGKLNKLPGMGSKKVANILRGLEIKQESHGRFLLDEATAHAEYLLDEFSKVSEIGKILVCGSLRRGCATIGDLDILVISHKPQKIMDAFVEFSIVQNVLSKGKTRSSVVLKNNMQVDLRVVEDKYFGAAAHYFTGCKAHDINLRKIAMQKGWKLSEYGLIQAKTKKLIAGKTEEEIFAAFGMQYIPPELREARGELKAAEAGKIPKLIELKQIRGDLHMHTKASDGSNTIEQMAEAAKALGYEYILISDHTQSTRIAHGLTEREMLKHIKEIRAANKKIKGIEILVGAEVDILRDGKLDYCDEILKQLDIVLATVHSSFKLPKVEMTKRITAALSNKYVNILVHPSDRLIGERDPIQVDMEKVLQTAKKHNVAMEVNSHPRRLDLTDIYCKRAKELGVNIVISTDAHSTHELKLMKYGVITARRGWLEAKNVLNTMPLAKLLKLL